mgnify:FL=1
MYLNCGLEGEEAVYITSSDGFYKLRGYSIYYERNQMMQDYMILRKDVPRAETGVMIRSSRTLSRKWTSAGWRQDVTGARWEFCRVCAASWL